MAKKAIVMSATSDIATAICEKWAGGEIEICGTYKTKNENYRKLIDCGVRLVYCDMADRSSVMKASELLLKRCEGWDTLLFATGTTLPVGAFTSVDSEEWVRSVHVNFIHPIVATRLFLEGHSAPEVGRALGARSQSSKYPIRKSSTSNFDSLASSKPSGRMPSVLYFAGGGTNNAVVNYSAYTVSKIALIKMCELLDAEIEAVKFSIIGPGWVKTKIHDATLKAGQPLAGKNYSRTIAKLESKECTPMDKVIRSVEWVLAQPKAAVGGRNFSTEFDCFESEELLNLLLRDPDMYKLRRFGNQRAVKV